jgi:hypothetical protein
MSSDDPCVHATTHDEDGTLDVVCTLDELPSPVVKVIDVGLSDHRLLHWSCFFHRPPPIYTTSTGRSWRQFDADLFQADLRASALCKMSNWQALDGDGLVALYDLTISDLLDRQVPFRSTRCRKRLSNAWFDDEGRAANRSLRAAERVVRRTGLMSDASRLEVASWQQQRHRYFDLLHQKRTNFWTARLDVVRLQPRRLRRSFNDLLGRGHAPLAQINAAVLHRHFNNMVAGVRTATADADPPCFTPAPVGCALRLFQLTTAVDAAMLVQALPDKQCLSDPLHTRLLKANTDALAPFLTHFFNWSLACDVFPSSFKLAYVTPFLKKPGIDVTDVKSYRPVSNLTVLSKLLERLVSQQLATYLKDNRLLPDLQSAYRSHHSTETAVLKVLSDILLALDSSDLAVLTLLDLSAAFNSVDQETPLGRLQQSYDLEGMVFDWFRSYLSGRTQCVHSLSTKSVPSAVLHSVPQGSVLGPILFTLYAADMLQLVKLHQLHLHAYADDTQIYGFCRPSDTSALQQRVSECVDDDVAA